MKQNKQSKIVAILALCVSILGLTLGFAAFSNTLTISSSATVTPDASDFKMVIYGLANAADYKWDVVENAPYFTSKTYSDPLIDGDTTAPRAIIDNDNLTIKNMNPTVTEPGKYAVYTFKIVNEGKYTAYLSADEVHALKEKIDTEKQCIPAAGTTASYVAETCKSTDYYIDFIHPDGDSLSNYPGGLEKTLAIEPNDYVELMIQIQYGISDINGNQVLADGDWYIKFPDIKLNFSTVNPDAQ